MNLAAHFFSAARRHPHKPALVFPERSVSYAELAASVNRLSRALRERPSEPYVALLASRSVSAYAGVLAILQAGRAYVPLNPAFPAARNRYILERTQAKTLLLGPECAGAYEKLAPQLSSKLSLIALERTAELDAVLAEHPLELQIAAESAPRAEPDGVCAETTPEQTAYVLFTSGSTGKPKGVVVRHRNVQRYLQNFLELYPISSDDRLTQLFDLTFDLSVHDMFVTWAAGATLVVYPSSLASPIPHTREMNVSVWFSVPSVAAHLEASRMLDVGSLENLRLSLFCGEKLTFNTWQLWKRVAPRSRVVNLYGPTETTIAITHFEVPEDFPEATAPRGTIPIGAPFRGQHAELRPDGLGSAPAASGELWLSGDQIAVGYLGEPELTSERFQPAAERIHYRTGDWVERGADGQLAFIGREDSQVKIMGYRVELGEVEHALMQAAGSASAIVLVESRNGVEELVAVMPSAVKAKKKELKRLLQDALPSYMLPKRFVFVPDFPVNANGKVDRKALSESIRELRDD